MRQGPVQTFVRLMLRVRSRLGELWWYTTLGFLLSRMGDVINVFIGMWLVLKLLPGAELGALQPVMNVGLIYTIPLAILLLPVPKYISLFAAKGQLGQARALLRDAVRLSLVAGIGMLVAILWSGDAILLRLRVGDRRMLWIIAGFAAMSALTPILSSAQQALKRFDSMMWAGFLSPYLRLAGMLVLLPTLGSLGYLLTQLGLVVFTAGAAGVALLRAVQQMPPAVSYRPWLRDMAFYAFPLALAMVVNRVQTPVEAVVFRHRLPNEASAAYLVMTMFGAIPSYIGSAVMPFLWVHASERHEKGQETQSVLLQSLKFNFLVGGAAAIVTGIAAPWVFRMPGPWRPHASYAFYIWPICALNLVRTGIGVFASHEAACRRFGYMWYLIPLSLVCTAALWILPAWHVMRPYLSVRLWTWVNGWAEPSMGLFLGIMLATSCGVLAGIVAQMGGRWYNARRAK